MLTQNPTEYVFKAQIFRECMARKHASQKQAKTSKHTRKRAASKRTTRATHEHHAEHAHEHREQLHRARRAIRALRHLVILPRAVIHTTKLHVPERLMEEVPEQAMIEHWEALGELKGKGIEIRPTRTQARQHLTREIELNAPISAHARHFAAEHGLIIRERKSPWRSSMERIFG